jgi:hypothetical protein
MVDELLPAINSARCERRWTSLMRRLALMTLMAAISLPAWAIRHLTVAQLEKTLASSVARHHSDAEMVREFGDFDLTERLTDATRQRICESLRLGPQTTLSLQLLADESAILDPPAGELPQDAVPDAAKAKRIFEAATGYVTQTLPHLPDFFATRTTYTFNDTAQIFKLNEWPVSAGLHLIGSNTREITFRDDHEVMEPAPQGSKAAFPARPIERGLQSTGEFGALLGIIFVDAPKGTVAFHHWEKTSAGLVAVFHYTVPKLESHYTVNYCCLADGLRTNTRQGGGRRGGSVVGNQQGNATVLYHKTPAYHGSIFIDPTSGVVHRVTLQAEMGDSAVSRAATVIEYGQVVIGDRKFICPLRSMILYEGPAENGPSAYQMTTTTRALEPTGTLYVNETSFTNYHRLGSEIRIITDSDAPPASRP